MSESLFLGERVQQIIERARREGRTTLDLATYVLGGSLDEIPEEVFDLPQLETLDLTGNMILEVPERIRDLVHLKQLRITGNPIEKIPDIPGLALDWKSYQRCREMLSRQNVEELSIDTEDQQGARIKWARGSQMRRELALLPGLRRLLIGLRSLSSDTQVHKPMGELRDLIDHLGQFPHIEALTLFGILLLDVPEGIRDLKRLRALRIEGAGLRQIPDWLGELEHLHSLGLGINELTALPDSLARLSEIERLTLSNRHYQD